MFRAAQSVRSLSTTAARSQDLIQQAFVKNIREFAKNAGNLANSDPAVKKALQDELNRLATKFQLASADVVSKLPTNFESAKVDSAVQSALEGKTLAQLLEGVKKEHADYVAARDAKKAEQAARNAALKQ
uniref:ATP synthase-coupling factor 6, mitochondrial n=1 Tax=Caenorhabditis japonica TaxID=281687 RepID=A0A8R1DPU1_CAEJA